MRNTVLFWRLAYAESGNTSEARKILTQLKGSNNSMSPYWIAGIYTGLEEKDQAIKWLEKAFQQRTLNLNIKVLPHFERLHSDPRFQDLIRRIYVYPNVTNRLVFENYFSSASCTIAAI